MPKPTSFELQPLEVCNAKRNIATLYVNNLTGTVKTWNEKCDKWQSKGLRRVKVVKKWGCNNNNNMHSYLCVYELNDKKATTSGIQKQSS